MVDGLMNRWTLRLTDRKWSLRQIDGQCDRQMDSETDRQRDSETDSWALIQIRNET